MALDGSYSGLRASLSDTLEKYNLTSAGVDFISLAEAEINRRLTIDDAPLEMIGHTTLSADSEFVDVPSDFMGLVSLHWTSDGTTAIRPLQLVSPTDIAVNKDRYPTATGLAVMYAIVGPYFQFWPAPTVATSADIVYIQRIPALSQNVPRNWLLSGHPDCYYYGALVQAAPFVDADTRVQMVPLWQQQFDRILTSIIESARRAKQGPDLPLRVDHALHSHHNYWYR